MQTGTASAHAKVQLALADADFRADATTLSDEQRAEWMRLRSGTRRRNYLNSRVLLNAEPAAVKTSLAHSGDHVLVGWCDQPAAFGIDIEERRPRDVVRLAEFAFAPGEVHLLASLAGDAQLDRFYGLWVMKEACAKALGVPLVEALRSFDFSTERVGEGGLQVQVLEPAPGLFVGLAVEAKTVSLRCIPYTVGASHDWKVRLKAIVA